jgi:hypothetical protein
LQTLPKTSACRVLVIDEMAKRVLMTLAQQTKIVTKLAENGRWKFGSPSILHPGTVSYSLNTWATKAGALRAGRREYNQI